MQRALGYRIIDKNVFFIEEMRSINFHPDVKRNKCFPRKSFNHKYMGKVLIFSRASKVKDKFYMEHYVSERVVRCGRRKVLGVGGGKL
mgnify:CR=1 FL=1